MNLIKKEEMLVLDYECSSCLTKEMKDRLKLAKSILAFIQTDENVCGTESCTVFSTINGKVGVFEEGSDYSGHG
jgi:hypothetical protein